MLEGTPLHRPSIAVDADWLPQIANDIAAHIGGAPPFIQQELSRDLASYSARTLRSPLYCSGC